MFFFGCDDFDTKNKYRYPNIKSQGVVGKPLVKGQSWNLFLTPKPVYYINVSPHNYG